MKSKYHKKRDKIILAVILLLCVSLGFAFLQANLTINGTAAVPNSSWDIHFNNVQVNSSSVSGAQVSQAATIGANTTSVSYNVTLSNPGDFYEFTVDAVNNGSIDAMIESVSSKYNNTEITTGTVPNCLNYSVTYIDGVAIANNHLLAANTTETYKVRIEFKDNETLNPADLPENGINATLDFSVTYVQADDNAIAKPSFFASASWNNIVSAYNSGNTTYLQQAMTAGTTREVQLDLNNDGTAETTGHVRIVNLSTPAECSTTGFSQTACGFVIEFSDIITEREMGPYDSSSTASGNGNIGGWPASPMRTYLNDSTQNAQSIYNALPNELSSKIIPTYVVSGHGSTTGETNFTSTDKVYFFSVKELGFSVNYDTAKTETRVLDYYEPLTDDMDNYIKKYQGTAMHWWLRTPFSNDNKSIYNVNGGYWRGSTSSYVNGVSPAFRIG